jgi:hypothetical protein
MNSAGFSSKEGKRSTPVENVAQLDCSLADQHVCIAHFKAHAWAKFPACACCRGSRRYACAGPVTPSVATTSVVRPSKK